MSAYTKKQLKAFNASRIADVDEAHADALATVSLDFVSLSANEAAYNAIQSALHTREVYQRDVCKNAVQAAKFAFERKAFTLSHASALVAASVDCDAVAKRIAQSQKTDESFVAIYAMQKVRKLLSALVAVSQHKLDSYTHAILTNAKALAASNERINNKTCLVSLSRAIEFTEHDQVQAVIARHKCEATTASTQASSTRKALATLTIAEYDRQDKALRLNDNAIAAKALALI